MKLGKIVKRFKSEKGNDVVIRYPRWQDLDDLLEYANDLIKENTYVQLSGNTLTRENEKKYLTESITKMKKGKKVHLVLTVNGKFAGNSEIRRFDRRSGHVGEIGISVAKAYRDEGIGTEFLQTLIDEGKRIGLKLLTLNCFECNDLAIHVYEKVGFKKAGTVPGMYNYKNHFVGEVKMYLPVKEGSGKNHTA